MCKFKTQILITFLLTIFFSFNSYGFYHNTSLNQVKTIKDSILVLKSESTQVIVIKSDEIVASNTGVTTNYHIINFDTSQIILFFKRKGKEWESKSYEYYSTKESKEMIVFDTTSDTSLNVYLTINPFESIVYSQRDGTVLTFNDLEIVENGEFNKLGLYKWKDSYQPIEYSKKIIITEHIKDFEYSEYWRKESFKKAITYIQQKMGEAKPKCEMVRRSPYNPTLVQYIGNQGLRIKLYSEYDCNQDYPLGVIRNSY